LAEYGSLADETIWAHVRNGHVPDPLTAAEALAINHIKRLFQVTIVSEGLTPAMAEAMGFRHVAPSALEDYLRGRLAQAPDLRLGVLRQSAEVLPVLRQAGVAA
jgi:hypothetical protein